ADDRTPAPRSAGSPHPRCRARRRSTLEMAARARRGRPSRRRSRSRRRDDARDRSPERARRDDRGLGQPLADRGRQVSAKLPDMALVTWDEFVALPEDDRRELIDGVLVEVEVPNHPHEKIVAFLCHYLVAWTLEHDPGATVLSSGYKVRIAKYRGVMPDV